MFALRLIVQNSSFLNKRIFFNTPNTFKEGRRQISMSVDHLPDTAVESDKFLAELPDIVSVITSSDRFQTLSEARMWVEKLIAYNSTGGKKTRGLMTVAAYQMVEKPENINEETMRQARVLGWCVELLQTCMLLLDDIIDSSSTRRGQTCWYRLPGVGMRALNDSTILIAIVFETLKVNFGGKPYYAGLIEIFNETILQLSVGQHLDCSSAKNYNLFTEKNYNNIAIYKTAYYTYKLPIFASLLLANKSIEDVFRNTEDTLDMIGILTLIQNDFMDCYGEDISGKLGTDIKEGKCTWLAVKALQQCNESQRTEFMQSYGNADEEAVQRIKRLYEDLQLPAQYQDTEQRTYENIVRRLKALPENNVIPSALILKLFHMVYRLWHTSNATSLI